MKRGYFEIGIFQPKKEENVGTLWRSALQLGASGIFTIGKRYSPQASDTSNSYRHLPLRYYTNFSEFYSNLAHKSKLVGVEMGGRSLTGFVHPEQCVYLLGAEDFGLPKEIQQQCWAIVSLDSINQNSYNVAVAGSLVMYNRVYGN